MEIFKIILLGVVSTMLIALVRESKPELAVLLGVASGIAVLIMVVDALFDIVNTFYNIAYITGLSSNMFAAILKIIGIGYITEFAANICVDAGNKSIGDKISFAGKIVILVLSLPIVEGVVSVIAEMLG